MNYRLHMNRLFSNANLVNFSTFLTNIRLVPLYRFIIGLFGGGGNVLLVACSVPKNTSSCKGNCSPLVKTTNLESKS